MLFPYTTRCRSEAFLGHVGVWIEGVCCLLENSDFARRCVEPIYGCGRREVRKGEEGFRITTLATEAGCRPDIGNRYVPRRCAVQMNHVGHCLGVLQISETDLVAHHRSTDRREGTECVSPCRSRSTT